MQLIPHLSKLGITKSTMLLVLPHCTSLLSDLLAFIFQVSRSGFQSMAFSNIKTSDDQTSVVLETVKDQSDSRAFLNAFLPLLFLNKPVLAALEESGSECCHAKCHYLSWCAAIEFTEVLPAPLLCLALLRPYRFPCFNHSADSCATVSTVDKLSTFLRVLPLSPPLHQLWQLHLNTDVTPHLSNTNKMNRKKLPYFSSVNAPAIGPDKPQLKILQYCKRSHNVWRYCSHITHCKQVRSQCWELDITQSMKGKLSKELTQIKS